MPERPRSVCYFPDVPVIFTEVVHTVAAITVETNFTDKALASTISMDQDRTTAMDIMAAVVTVAAVIAAGIMVVAVTRLEVTAEAIMAAVITAEVAMVAVVTVAVVMVVVVRAVGITTESSLLDQDYCRRG